LSILKKLREIHLLSQKQLAAEINVDLKNLEQWEKSPKSISNNDLSSIAYYFGLSSEELKDAIIGNVTDLSTNNYHIQSYKNFLDGWWGHIGVCLNNQSKTQWFPITVNTASRVSNILANYESRIDWIVLDTLNNRTIAFEPSRLKNIWLLDESAAPPSDDWDEHNDYKGMPGEFYKALEAFYMEADGIELDKNEEVSVDFPEFIRHLIMSKLNWRIVNERYKIYS
jgi:transcriptional regulator with XRE-family HTH domain